MSESNAFRQFVTIHDADPIRKRVSPDWTAVPSGLIQAEGPFKFFNEVETQFSPDFQGSFLGKPSKAKRLFPI